VDIPERPKEDVPCPESYTPSSTGSVFATLECELIDRTSFKNLFEARAAVFEFIEDF